MFSGSGRTAVPLLFATIVTASALFLSTGPFFCSNRAGGARAETARIKAHLARVEAELQRADLSSLSPSQRHARRVQIARLHEYRVHGKFPHNHDFQNRRVPYFSDRHGTLCAMAYLIAKSGRRDIVEAVHIRANNARVTDLAADRVLGPILMSWLADAGLTVAEAQRVQPAYIYEDYEEPITTAQAVASGALGAANLASIAVNGGRATAGTGPTWTAPVGLALGAGQIGLGAASLSDEGERRVLGIANVAVGFAAIVVSTLAFVKESPSSPSASTSGAASPTLHAMVTTVGHGGPALGIRARFW